MLNSFFKGIKRQQKNGFVRYDFFYREGDKNSFHQEKIPLACLH